MPTKISWTDETWNPVTGCSHVSEGCRNCYAEALSHRFGWTTAPWTAQNAAQNVVTHPERIAHVRRFKAGSKVFVCSMSDLFHEEVPDAFVRAVLEAIESRPDCTFQLLTKRPERMLLCPIPENVWAGTTVEDPYSVWRIGQLRRSTARTRFLSVEPLLGQLGTLDLRDIDWVIVGGESGPRRRPMDMAWAREVRDQCVAAGVAFFFKQAGGPRPGTPEYLIEEDGSAWLWRQWPGQLVPPERVALGEERG